MPCWNHNLSLYFSVVDLCNFHDHQNEWDDRHFCMVGMPFHDLVRTVIWQAFRIFPLRVRKQFNTGRIIRCMLGVGQKTMLVNIVAAMAWAGRVLVIAMIIIMATTAVGATTRAASRVGMMLWETLTIIIVVGGVRITIVLWWQIRSMTSQGRRCTRFWLVCTFMYFFKVFGSLCTSGGVVHFALRPFNCMGVFSETTLVARIWWTGIMVLTRARSIEGSLLERCEGGLVEDVLSSPLSQWKRPCYTGRIGLCCHSYQIFWVDGHYNWCTHIWVM